MNYKNLDLVQLNYNKLHEYIGLPVLMVTPVYTVSGTYVGKTKATVFKEEIASSYEWIIFDGTVVLSPETQGRTYWTLHELITI